MINVLNKVLICVVSGIFAVTMIFPKIGSNAKELEPVVENGIEQQYRYELVREATCSVSITSGTATVASKVKGKTGVSSSSVNVYLEKLVNGSWQLYTSWSHSGGGEQSNSDSTTVTHGAYRVWMSVTVSGTGGSESFNVDGNTVGY